MYADFRNPGTNRSEDAFEADWPKRRSMLEESVLSLDSDRYHKSL